MSENTSVNRDYKLDKDGLECKLNANVDGAHITSAFDIKVAEISRTQRFPGFRKGSLAIPMIKQRFGPSILQDLAQELTEKSLQEVVTKEAIEIAGSPKKIEVTQLKLGEDLVYDAEFDILPDFSLKDLKKLQLLKPEVSLDKADEKEVLDKVLQDNADWSDSDKAAKNGCRVTIDFTGKIDDVAFEGGSGKDSVFTLGEKQMLPDFEKGVVGKKAGENAEVVVNFPADYHAEHMRGKKADFSIEVKRVEVSKLPKLDDKFLEKLKIKDTSVEDYKKSLIEKKASEIPWLLQRMTHKRVMDVLGNDYDFPVPGSLVQAEVVEMRKDPNTMSQYEEKDLDQKAADNIRLTLVIRKLVDHFKLTVDQAKVNSYLTNMAPDFIDAKTFISWYENDPQRMERVKIAVLEQQVVEKVMDESGAKVEKLSFAAAEKTLKTE